MLLYDRFGRALQAGDVVHLLAKTDIFWKVVHTKPIMDPKAPPGAVELALQAVFIAGLPGGQQIMDLIKVLDAPPQAHGQEAGNGNQVSAEAATDRQHVEEHPSGEHEDPPPARPRAVD